MIKPQPALTTLVLVFGLLLPACLELELPPIGMDPLPPSGKQHYKVTGFNFADSPKRPKRDYVRGAKKKDEVDLRYHFWLLEGGGKKILVDPGFYSDRLIQKERLQSHERPDHMLERVGVRPADITHILLTHMHATAIEGVKLFPEATAYVQSGAFALARRWLDRRKAVPNQATEDTIRHLMERERAGKLVTVDGCFELFDGIKVHSQDLHTQYYSYYSVNTDDGPVVIASDLVPFYENVRRKQAIRDTKMRSHMVDVYGSMRKLTGSSWRVLPLFDPKALEHFGGPEAHIYTIPNR